MSRGPDHTPPRLPLHGLLLRAADLATEEFHVRLREHGFQEIRPGHGCVFGFIEAEGSRLTDLAARAGLTKQAVGEAATDLERLGYVERVPDPEDGRAKLIKLTARGEEARALGFELFAELDAEWEERYGRERVRQLRLLLEEIAAPPGSTARMAA